MEMDRKETIGNISLKDLNINEILEYYGEEEILKEMGISFKKDILDDIKDICRKLKPNGYIGKEEAKALLCDYIDTWMTKSF